METTTWISGATLLAILGLYFKARQNSRMEDESLNRRIDDRALSKSEGRALQQDMKNLREELRQHFEDVRERFTNVEQLIRNGR